MRSFAAQEIQGLLLERPKFVAFLRLQKCAEMWITGFVFARPLFGKITVPDILQGRFHESFQLQFFEAGQAAEDPILSGQRREAHRV